VTGFNNERAVIDGMFDSWTQTQVVRENTEVGTANEWIRPSIQAINGNRMNLGDNPKYRYTGLLYVQIFTLTGIGSGRAKVLADLLTQMFRDVRSGGITFKVPQFEAVGNQDNWYQSVFSVEFFREE
jgi:hypothetical protein